MFLTAFVDFPGISPLIPWNSVLSNDDSLNGSCSLRYQSFVIWIGFESPVCVEVDSLEEFNYIEYQLNQHNSELLSYLDTFDSYYGN